MAAFRLLLACCVLLVFPMFSDTLPEPGKLNMEFKTYDNFLGFSKALYKGATISVKGTCFSAEKNRPKITISWKLKYTQCADLFASVKENSQLQNVWVGFPNHEMYGEDTVECNNNILLKDMSSQPERIVNDTHPEAAESQKDDVADEGIENKKRDDKEKQTKGKEENKDKNKLQIKKDGGSSGVKKESNEVNHSTQNANKGKKGKGKAAKPGDTNKANGNNEQNNSNAKNQDKNGKKAKGKSVNRQERSVEMKQEETFRTLVRVKRDVETDESDNNVPSKEEDQDKTSQDNKAGTTDDNGNNGSDDSGDKDKAAKDAPKKEDSESKAAKVPKNPVSKKSSRLVVTRRDGIYLLIMTVIPAETDKSGKEPSFDLKLEVAMESKSGYLSATDWPLLPFYGVMSLVYLFYGIIWLIVSACQWRDLLRIQFWIGGVIALGMLEKAVFYSEYNNINNTGITTPSLVVFAEIVSVAKRTLARMLVIIVSMGFGIVKPRLGKSLHRVMGVGALYFIIGIVEGCLRSLSFKADPSKEQLIAGIPLAVLDAAICWWIFMSLVQTTRTLRIRRNVIKLSLYRHFTNTLIFAVLASVAYMIWSIKTHKFAECIKDWSELWLDEAFWHFLFSIILLVIMVLWRPTANNQRYAFTPIVDFDDDDEDNVTLSEAFDGMKMRNTRTEVIVNGDSKKKAEDDLKWVEENIPSSAADTVLPSVLDSDEELMTTKFEMSKME